MKKTRYVVFFIFIIIGELAYAGSGTFTDRTAIPDLATSLEHLKTLIPVLNTVLEVVCYLLGIMLIIKAIIGLKNFGQINSQTKGEISGPLVYLIIGACLVYLPDTMQTAAGSMFGSNVTSDFLQVDSDLGGVEAMDQDSLKASIQLYGYFPESLTAEGQWAELIDTIVIFMQFIGFLAFVRGMFIISQSGQPGVQPGSITKGIIHTIGGLLAINFIPAVKLINETLRIGSS